MIGISDRLWLALAPAVVIFGSIGIAVVIYAVRWRRRGSYRDAEIASRGSSMLLGMPLRQFFTWLTSPLLRLLQRSGLPPTVLTTVAVLLALAAAISVAQGHFAAGGWLFLAGALCDFFDGRLARATGKTSRAGGVLDSVLDRCSDLALLAGLGWYYRASWVVLPIWGLAIGTALVPYIRARGEAIGVKVSVGLMQRPERVVYLGLSLALSPIVEALRGAPAAHPLHPIVVVTLVLTALATLATAGQRLAHLVRQVGRGVRLPTWAGDDASSVLTFGAVAAGITAAEFGLFALLVARFDWSPGLATLAGAAVGAALSLAIHALAGDATSRRVRRYTLLAVVGALLSAASVTLLLPVLPYAAAWIVARSAVTALWSYPLHREYVFDDDAATAATLAARRNVPPRPQHGAG